jgi:hypothetical protein
VVVTAVAAVAVQGALSIVTPIVVMARLAAKVCRVIELLST